MLEWLWIHGHLDSIYERPGVCGQVIFVAWRLGPIHSATSNLVGVKPTGIYIPLHGLPSWPGNNIGSYDLHPWTKSTFNSMGVALVPGWHVMLEQHPP